MTVTRRRAALAALLAALLPAAAPAQQAIFVVRHAEKESPASEPSVPLSEAGRARAARLAAMLKDAGVTSIYSTDTVRTRSTAGPLAEAVKHPIQIYTDVAALAGELRREPQGVVLVVGHSNTVPKLLSALGAGRLADDRGRPGSRRVERDRPQRDDGPRA